MDKSWPSNRRERMVEYVGEDGDFEEFDSTGETAVHHEEVMRRLYNSDKERKAAVKEWKVDNGEAVDSSESEYESESGLEEQEDTPTAASNALFEDATVYEDSEATESTDEATECLEAAQWEALMRNKALLNLQDEPESSRRPRKKGPVAVGDCTGEVIKISSSELNGKCVTYVLQWSNGGKNQKAFSSGKIPRDLVEQYHRENPSALKGKGVDKPAKGVAKKKNQTVAAAAAQRQPAKAYKPKTIKISAIKTGPTSSVMKSKAQSVNTQIAAKASPIVTPRSSTSTSTQFKQTYIQHATNISTPAILPAATVTKMQQLHSSIIEDAAEKTACTALVHEIDSDDGGLWGDGDSDDDLVDGTVTVPAIEQLRMPTPSITGYGDDGELNCPTDQPAPTSAPSPSAQDDASFDEEFHNEWNSVFANEQPVADLEANLSAPNDVGTDEDSATLSEQTVLQQPETQIQKRFTMTRAQKGTHKEKKRVVASAARKPNVLTMLQTTINNICLFQKDAALCAPKKDFPLPDDEATKLLGKIILGYASALYLSLLPSTSVLALANETLINKPEPNLQEVMLSLGLNDERGSVLCNDLREVQNGIGCSLRLEGDLSEEHKMKYRRSNSLGQHPTDILLAFCKLVYRAAKKYEARRQTASTNATTRTAHLRPHHTIHCLLFHAPIHTIEPVSGPAAFGQAASAYIAHSTESQDSIAYGHPIVPSFSQYTAAGNVPTSHNPTMAAAPACLPAPVSVPVVGQTMPSNIQRWPFHDDETIVIDEEEDEEVMASTQALLAHSQYGPLEANTQSVAQGIPAVAQLYSPLPSDFMSLGQNGSVVVASPCDYPVLGRAVIDQYTAEPLDPASFVPGNLHVPNPPAAAKRPYEAIELDSDADDVTAPNPAKRARLTPPAETNDLGDADGESVFDHVDESAAQKHLGPPEPFPIAASAVQGDQRLVEVPYHKTNAMQSTWADFTDHVYDIPESQNQASSTSQSDIYDLSLSGALPAPSKVMSAERSRMPQLLAKFLNERKNLERFQKRGREQFLHKMQPQQAEIERLIMISKQENLVPVHQRLYKLQAEKMQLDILFLKNVLLREQIKACKHQLGCQQETHKQLVRMRALQANTSNVAHFFEATHRANKMAHSGVFKALKDLEKQRPETERNLQRCRELSWQHEQQRVLQQEQEQLF